MSKTFQTATCHVCHAEVDDAVAAVERELPGVTMEYRFCSDRHRQDYLDSEGDAFGSDGDPTAPAASVARQLREGEQESADVEGDE